MDEVTEQLEQQQAQGVEIPMDAPELTEVDPAFLDAAAAATAQSEAPPVAGTLPGKRYTKEQLAEAEETALNIIGAAFVFAQEYSGKPLGLNEKKAIKTAKGVAPCLAKYGLTDTAGVFSKWGEELQAAVAIGGVLFGVWVELKKGADYGDKPEQQQAA